MTSPIYGSRMLRTARLLARPKQGAGRPAYSDLRRATSTAYYAIFHQILRHGAFDFLPSARETEVAKIARWYTHGGIAGAAELVGKVAAGVRPSKHDVAAGDVLLHAAGSGGLPSELELLAEAFLELQDARHRADYDGDFNPLRAVALNHISSADAALSASRHLWGGGTGFVKADRQEANSAYRAFLRIALLKSGGPKSR